MSARAKAVSVFLAAFWSTLLLADATSVRARNLYLLHKASHKEYIGYIVKASAHFQRFVDCITGRVYSIDLGDTVKLFPSTCPKNAEPGPGFAIAPGDEYFGRMKYSALGILNEIRSARAHSDNPDADRSLPFTEEALIDWAHRYPRDPWLPRMYWELGVAYSSYSAPNDQEGAVRIFRLTQTLFPKSRFARCAVRALQEITEASLRPSPSPAHVASSCE